MGNYDNGDSSVSKKRRIDETQNKIILKVKSQDGNEDHFRIQPNIKLIKLMWAYCDKKNIDYRAVRFFYNGDRLNGTQTPLKLKMENGDEIDALMEMPGGGSGSTLP